MRSLIQTNDAAQSEVGTQMSDPKHKNESESKSNLVRQTPAKKSPSSSRIKPMFFNPRAMSPDEIAEAIIDHSESDS